MDIRELFKSYKELDGKTVEVQAWIKNLRAQKEFGFIEINDGSFFSSVQVVYDNTLENFERVSKLYLSASIRVKGKLVLTPNNKQAFEIKAEEIDESVFETYLDTHGIPDPDMMIRTSGEQRLSNYLLWQLAYSEFYFTDVPWPDFTKEELVKAIEEYNHRHRRFGKVEEA